MAQLEHDPDSRLDYSWDWDKWLGHDETITNHSISILPAQPADGVKLDDSDIYPGGKSVVAWLTGGVENTEVGVTCHIVTSEGREDDRTIDLWVKER